MKSILRARPKQVLFAAGALVAALATAGCGAKPVATIAGLPVGQDEFNERCSDYVMAGSVAGQTVGVAVLGSLIPLKIMEKELQRVNKMPSDADVNRRMDALKKQFAFFGQPLDEQLHRQGRSEASLRRDMRDQLVTEEYRIKDVKVSDAEARHYYDTHPSNPDWSVDERIQISTIAVDNKADLDRAVSELKSNAKFLDVARAVTKGQLQQMSGPVSRWFTRKDLQNSTNLPIPPLVVQRAFDLSPGQFSDPPVRLGLDAKDPSKAVWFIVQLDQKKPAERMPFEDAKEFAVRALRFEKAQPKMGELANDFKKQARDADIQVSRPEWQEMVKQYRQAMLGGGAASPGPAP